MSEASKPIPERSCINCQFFIFYSLTQRDYKRETDGYAHSIFRQEHREVVHKSKDGSGYGQCGCHFGVWSELVDGSIGERRAEVILHTDRKDECFFRRYNPEMSLEAAEILQNREEAHREATIDRKNTTKSLWIAIAALIVTAACQLLTAILQVQAVNTAATQILNRVGIGIP